MPVNLPNEDCTKGISFANIPDNQVHRLTTELNDFARIHVVNADAQLAKLREHDPGSLIRQGKKVEDAVSEGFASGLLTLSEVVFDKTGRYAVMSFGFRCGQLCGHGGTLIFKREKSGNWKQTKRPCSIWMS